MRSLPPRALLPLQRTCALLVVLCASRINAKSGGATAPCVVGAAVVSVVAAALGPGSPKLGAAAAVEAASFDLIPPAVVVHGRRGRNSNINGVYTRDLAWHGQVGPCYRRSGAAGQATIFLYFEGEWRMGPSPEEGSVWAYARSDAASPLLIDAPWEVWDGQRVERDPRLRVSDTSVIPSVVFLSFGGEEVPVALRKMQGMLLQQPGLWDGRPYYRHQAFADLFLLCSFAEGRWRLGPLPLAAVGADMRPALFAVSAAAVPQEIAEPWYSRAVDGGHVALGEGVVRLAATAGALPAVGVRRHGYPRHLVVEGVEVGGGLANGVYRLAKEESGYRPVYHKTDALRAASLWFAGGAWCLGAAAPEGPAWVCAASGALSPLGIDAPWRGLDRAQQPEEAARIAEAPLVTPGELFVLGDRYVQEHQLCDARPVYRRDVVASAGWDVVADARAVETEDQHEAADAVDGAAPIPVYLFFRAHEGEWWLGPVVGGTECIARAVGSRLRVVPVPEELVWWAPSAAAAAHSSPPLPLEQTPLHAGGALAGGGATSVPSGALGDMSAAGDGWDLRATDVRDAGQQQRQRQLWWGVAVATLLVACSARFARVVVAKGDEAPCCRSGLVAAEDEARSWLPGVDDSSTSEAYPLPSQYDGAAAGGQAAPRRGRSSALACVVCFEAPRQILLMPCRHVCCCKACADRLELCPMCRTPKTDFTKVFL